MKEGKCNCAGVLICFRHIATAETIPAMFPVFHSSSTKELFNMCVGADFQKTLHWHSHVNKH